ncbi:exported hypothetical protein [Verrucomicrobia bacterium]|nr:exported hypothetical protein [Verrucomicrobiota bacterium]
MKVNLKIVLVGVAAVFTFTQAQAMCWYSPSTAHWLTRDPVGEPGASLLNDIGGSVIVGGGSSEVIGGPNLYAFGGNSPVNNVDILGLWNEDVHRGRTTQWAGQLGISSGSATAIGIADNDIDTLFRPDNLPLTDRKFSWHFNRSVSGGDSRLEHRDKMVKTAQIFCTGDVDDPNIAARFLGYALHPLQDWVAHADFDRRQEAPSLTTSTWESRLYAHNYPHFKKPDNPSLDSDGVDGRATIDVLHLSHTLSNGDRVYTANFHPGTKRITKTEHLTKDLLTDFQGYVRVNAKACGRCRQAFLPSN